MGRRLRPHFRPRQPRFGPARRPSYPNRHQPGAPHRLTPRPLRAFRGATGQPVAEAGDASPPCNPSYSSKLVSALSNRWCSSAMSSDCTTAHPGAPRPGPGSRRRRGRLQPGRAAAREATSCRSAYTSGACRSLPTEPLPARLILLTNEATPLIPARPPHSWLANFDRRLAETRAIAAKLPGLPAEVAERRVVAAGRQWEVLCPGHSRSSGARSRRIRVKLVGGIVAQARAG